MPHTETLLAIAALAIALQGFAGLAFVVRQAALDGRFWSMLASGFAVLAMAVLPLPLFALGLPERVLWPMCNVLLALSAALLAAWSLSFSRINREINRRLSVPMPTASFAVSLGLLIAIAALQILAFFQTGQDSAYQVFAAGLGLLVVRTAFVFIRLLVAWTPQGHEDA
jgi:hypothetical protein